MDLTDKVALVTGGTRGIGASIARQAAARGAHLSIIARNLDSEAHQVQQEIQSLGRKCLLLSGDLSRPADCIAAVSATADHFGRLDALVHNAGGPAHGRLEILSPEVWQAALDLHVTANFHLAQAALPWLRKQKEGAIVTVSSTAGIRGVSGAIAYATAKGAVAQFTRCLARELADDNIRVNCVAPGVIRTRFHSDMPPERYKLNIEQRIPLHREGTADQVAEVVLLLLTNDFITGEVFTIDGGLTSRIA